MGAAIEMVQMVQDLELQDRLLVRGITTIRFWGKIQRCYGQSVLVELSLKESDNSEEIFIYAWKSFDYYFLFEGFFHQK
ncbi:hypothetical protein MRB53_021476 [Persea americana]|uniref:Uncharacterized protein n=1 Tax=Persea americana TaxID=3435 RepID=A0ACC2L547_PERAE|nr:hypothetical protein MRB53_021476 [Persea americana]